jgi:hypothetical protein
MHSCVRTANMPGMYLLPPLLSKLQGNHLLGNTVYSLRVENAERQPNDNSLFSNTLKFIIL